MSNFNRDNRSGGGRGGNRFGGRNSRERGYGGRDAGNRSFGGRPTMYHAICDECGNDCEVPFKPSGDKPIYCSSCFEKRNGGSRSSNDRNERRFDRNDFGEKRMYHAICDNCGNEAEVPFKPSGDKPVYCSDCFEEMGNEHPRKDKSTGKNSNNELQEQINSLNAKLDQILEILGTKVISDPVTVRVEKKKKVAKEAPAEMKTEDEVSKPEKKKTAKKATAKKASTKSNE